MENNLEKPSRNLVVSKFDHGRDQDKYKLFEFEGDPNHIIRIDDFKNINAQIEEDLEPEVVIEKVRAIFDELKQVYGIHADVNFEINDSDDGKVLYTITDKIDGTNIEEVELNEENKIELAKKFENFFLYLTLYFIDKFNRNERVLWDIAHSSAYVYGRKSGDVLQDIYLVDTDLKLTSGKYGMLSFTCIFPSIKKIEIKTGIKMTSVREKLREFIGNIQTDPKNTYVSIIQQFLNE